MKSLRFALGAMVALCTVAAGPSQAQVITACVNRSLGTLRIISAGQVCTRFEALLTWNQTGPAGPGATVTALPVGDAHCPNGGAKITDGRGNVAYSCSARLPPAFFAVQPLPETQLPNSFAGLGGDEWADLADVSLPAGNYLLWASVQVAAGPNRQIVQCRISGSGRLKGLVLEPTAFYENEIIILDSLSTSTPVDLKLQCHVFQNGTSDPVPGEVWASDGRLSAVRVGSVN